MEAKILNTGYSYSLNLAEEEEEEKEDGFPLFPATLMNFQPGRALIKRPFPKKWIARYRNERLYTFILPVLLKDASLHPPLL